MSQDIGDSRTLNPPYLAKRPFDSRSIGYGLAPGRTGRAPHCLAQPPSPGARDRDSGAAGNAPGNYRRGELEGMIIDTVREGKSWPGPSASWSRARTVASPMSLCAHLGGQPVLNAYSGIFG